MNEKKLCELFYGMRKYFLPELAIRIHSDIEFRISGKEEAVFVMSFGTEKLDIRKGPAKSPSVVIYCDSEIVRNIFLGNISSVGAYLDGKIHIEGDPSIAIAVTQVFDRNIG